MRKKPWTDRELTENERIVQNPAARKGGWSGFFGNGNPVRLEIGCGKGRFIAAMARAMPDINFVALERGDVVLGIAARNAADIPNLAFIHADADNLTDYFGAGEIDKIYIRFCDPWPRKKKWVRRRLTHPRYLGMYREVLAERGGISFKTDNRTLFEYSITQFSAEKWLITEVSLDDRASAENDGETPLPMTEYEEKYVSRNMPIYRLEAVK